MAGAIRCMAYLAANKAITFMNTSLYPRDFPIMPGRVVWKIAAPSIGLGVFLLGLGVIAAWNVHKQQQTSSELVIREVRGMLAIDELHMAMREIRYQINIFLRTKDPQHLLIVPKLHEEADQLLQRAKGYARTDREQELIGVVELGYREFFEEFQALAAGLLPSRPEAETARGKSGRAARVEITSQ